MHKQTVTVVGTPDEPDVFSPDPAQRILIRNDVLAANPGRPGVPVSIPGLPAETASGGIKAPQYFAPGVAGDHGEPIAQFIAVGGFLFPNNLPANAHGNGYADPNILVPAVIESVRVDSGAFNILEGNYAVDLGVTYDLRPRMHPFLRLAGDYRDVDVIGGLSPANPETPAWISLEAAVGNGFLKLPEHRRQYKLNAFRGFRTGRHDVTLFGIGYYGISRLPGLIPTDRQVPNDTIDPRQSDQTHTALAVANDIWRLSNLRQLQFSGFFRTYNLDLASNFGDGLIGQTEFRTVTGANTTYEQKISPRFSLMAGMDYRRDAPRGLDLNRADQNGVFQPVTSNDLTVNVAAPFVAVDGKLTSFLHYNLGLRRDEVVFHNSDNRLPQNSFDVHSGVNSPKATLTLLPPGSMGLPSVALSFGQAFHTNDPRIGTGTNHGTVIARARAWQAVISKNFLRTDFRVALARVSNSAELAKIDPDTGLQENLGPSLIRSITVSAQHYFSAGSLRVSFARANATDRLTDTYVPEAPRLIWDLLGTVDRLPWGMQARGEFEYVGRTPLGDGFTSVALREMRGSLLRSFHDGHMDLGLNFLLASGYTGQTLEFVQLPDEPYAFERIVGVPLRSYVTLSWTLRR